MGLKRLGLCGVLFALPDLHVIDPDGGVGQETKPALHIVRVAFGAVRRHKLAVEGET